MFSYKYQPLLQEEHWLLAFPKQVAQAGVQITLTVILIFLNPKDSSIQLEFSPVVKFNWMVDELCGKEERVTVVIQSGYFSLPQMLVVPIVPAL